LTESSSIDRVDKVSFPLIYGSAFGIGPMMRRGSRSRTHALAPEGDQSRLFVARLRAYLLSTKCSCSYSRTCV